MRRNLLPLIGAAAAACALGLATAAPASADEQSYLDDINSQFDVPPSVALETGYEICTDREHGVPQDTTVQAIYDTTGDDIGYEEATYIYESAAIHLC